MDNQEIKPKIKKVQVYPFIDNLHDSYKIILENPPEGYEFIGIQNSKRQNFLKKVKSSSTAKFLYHLFLKVFKTSKIMDFVYSSKELEEVDLIYSINSLYSGNLSWVLELLDDTPYGLTGYNYYLFKKNIKKIEQILAKDNCKQIICTNKAALRMMNNFFSKEIRKKLVLVYRSFKNPSFIRKIKTKGPLRILFMGSINNPDDFYIKGGLEAVETFEKIKGDSKLILKCKIPEELRERILKNKNIIVIDQKISEDEIDKLYISSDIFLMPSHTFMGSITRAMSFGLPIITLDTFATEDYVKHNHDGIIIKKSDKIRAYNHETYPTNLRDNAFIKQIKNIDSRVIADLVTSLSLLIEDSSLRRKLGRNALKSVTEEYSLDKRRKLLKTVFDNAISDSPLDKD